MNASLPSRVHNVLHVLNSASGGAALSTIGLMRALRSHSVTSSAVCHDVGTTDERAALAEACDGRVVFTPLYSWNLKIRAATWKRPLLEARQLVGTGAAIWSTARVVAAAARFRAELIHSNTSLTLEGGVAARRARLPHVWHVRELVGPGDPFQFPIRGAQLGRYLAAHADVIVANSSATAARLRDIVPTEKLVIVDNGLELEPLLAVARARTARREPPRIGMVANLTSRTKRHALLLEALAQLPSRLRLEVSLIGQGEPKAGESADAYVKALMAQAAALPDHVRVDFPGFLSAPAAMERIDVLVHPAENESFGRVIIEAWAAGVAVVGVDGGGVGALVHDDVDGALARPNDAADLARTIERVVTDRPLRERMTRAGAERARSYSAEACAAHVVDVYSQALQRQREESSGARRWGGASQAGTARQ